MALSTLICALGLVATLGALPSGVLQTPNIVYRFEGEERASAEALAEVGEGVWSALCAELGGCPAGPPLTFVVARSNEHLRTLLGPGVPTWAAGVALPSRGRAGLHVQARGDGPLGEIHATFRHELAHVLLHRALGGAQVPRWFSEGFAILKAREWSFQRVQTLTRAALTGSLIGVSELERGFPRGAHKVSIAYAQAVSFVAFLMDEDRAAFKQLMATLRTGTPFRRALDEAYRRPLSELEARWHASLGHSYRFIPLLTGGSTLWVITTLIFLLSYMRRRKEAAATLDRWAREEAGHPLPPPPTDDGAPF